LRYTQIDKIDPDRVKGGGRKNFANRAVWAYAPPISPVTRTLTRNVLPRAKSSVPAALKSYRYGDPQRR